MNDLNKTIQRETKFSAVGLRLEHENDYPYFEQFGFSEDFLLTENTLTVKGRNGGICIDENGQIEKIDYICMCLPAVRL